MYHTLLLPDVREMLRENDAHGLAEFCEALHPAVVAAVMGELSNEEIWGVLTHCSLHRQVEIIEFLELPRQAELVASLDRERLSNLLQVMAPDDCVDLLEQMEHDQVERILPLFAQAQRRDIRRLLSYPEGSAGSIMTTEYASLREGTTVGDALNQLRLQAPNRETIYYVYVVDAERKLRGFVSLRRLILEKTTTPIADIMDRDVISVRVDEDQERVAQELAKYDFLAIPVVDRQNQLVGIITHDDILDVVQEEATEDAHRMGAVGPGVEHYLETSFVSIWWRRAGWLSCLFIAELFTFSALAYFEHAIAAVLALSLFLPLCISTGGNSGSQAATLITRAMALGQVSPGDWWRVLRHELMMGVALGFTLGAIGFLRAAVTPSKLLGSADRWELALVISQSVAAICLWGTLVGAMLPLIFRKLGFDPALASSPFVATFVDVTGIIIYFNIASVYVL